MAPCLLSTLAASCSRANGSSEMDRRPRWLLGLQGSPLVRLTAGLSTLAPAELLCRVPGNAHLQGGSGAVLIRASPVTLPLTHATM